MFAKKQITFPTSRIKLPDTIEYCNINNDISDDYSGPVEIHFSRSDEKLKSYLLNPFSFFLTTKAYLMISNCGYGNLDDYSVIDKMEGEDYEKKVNFGLSFEQAFFRSRLGRVSPFFENGGTWIKLIEQIQMETFFVQQMKGNKFSTNSEGYTRLGLTEHLRELIPPGYNFLTTLRKCECGYLSCSSIHAWIIHSVDEFYIPFFWENSAPGFPVHLTPLKELKRFEEENKEIFWDRKLYHPVKDNEYCRKNGRELEAVIGEVEREGISKFN